MATDIVLKQCIGQAEQLRNHIQNNCMVPRNCLGGQMYYEYEKVRTNQLAQIKAICNQLEMLSVNGTYTYSG